MFSNAQKTGKYLILQKKGVAISNTCLRKQLPLILDTFYISNTYATLMYPGLHSIIHSSTRKLLLTHRAVILRNAECINLFLFCKM